LQEPFWAHESQLLFFVMRVIGAIGKSLFNTICITIVTANIILF